MIRHAERSLIGHINIYHLAKHRYGEINDIDNNVDRIDATEGKYHQRKSHNVITFPELGNGSRSCELRKWKNSSSSEYRERCVSTV